MRYIKKSDLEAVCAHINRITGSPDTPYTQKDGILTANIGNYHLSGAYSGYALHQMVNEGGARDIFCGHFTKRDLYEKMHAFIRGFDTAKRSQIRQTQQ